MVSRSVLRRAGCRSSCRGRCRSRAAPAEELAGRDLTSDCSSPSKNSSVMPILAKVAARSRPRSSGRLFEPVHVQLLPAIGVQRRHACSDRICRIQLEEDVRLCRTRWPRWICLRAANRSQPAAARPPPRPGNARGRSPIPVSPACRTPFCRDSPDGTRCRHDGPPRRRVGQRERPSEPRPYAARRSEAAPCTWAAGLTAFGELRPMAFPSAAAFTSVLTVTSPARAIRAAGRCGAGSRRTATAARRLRPVGRRRSARGGRSGRRS